MGKRDKRVDEYIKNAQPFAKPILKHLRELLHAACPEVEETIKWSFPHFEYKGPLCHMASFKEHCSFGFWKTALMKDLPNHEEGMGQFGRITSVEDLPDEDILVEYINEAIRLNDEGIKLPKKTPKKTQEVEIPEFLLKALKKNAKAMEHFNAFSNSKKKDYVEWILDAKQEATRERRLESAIEWISEGKSKNWKYEKC